MAAVADKIVVEIIGKIDQHVRAMRQAEQVTDQTVNRINKSIEKVGASPRAANPFKTFRGLLTGFGALGVIMLLDRSLQKVQDIGNDISQQFADMDRHSAGIRDKWNAIALAMARNLPILRPIVQIATAGIDAGTAGVSAQTERMMERLLKLQQFNQAQVGPLAQTRISVLEQQGEVERANALRGSVGRAMIEMEANRLRKLAMQYTDPGKRAGALRQVETYRQGRMFLLNNELAGAGRTVEGIQTALGSAKVQGGATSIVSAIQQTNTILRGIAAQSGGLN